MLMETGQVSPSQSSCNHLWLQRVYDIMINFSESSELQNVLKTWSAGSQNITGERLRIHRKRNISFACCHPSLLLRLNLGVSGETEYTTIAIST